MQRRIYIVAGIIFSLFVASAFVAAQSARAQPTAPHIVNGDFEQDFTMRDNAPEVYIGVGWDYDYLPEGRWCERPCKRPEFKEERKIVYQGNSSQRWFTAFARQFGAIHQSVDVEAGEWYEFSCWAYAISEPDGQQAIFAGANPWNGQVFDRTMVWGQQQPWGSYREWNKISVTFQAWHDQVRVAVGTNNNWATLNNAGYVDSCTIRRVDGPVGPTPTPAPTSPVGPIDYDRIRQITREELDATTWGSK